MQCKCGAETIDRYVTKNKERVGYYKQCVSCKRIEWIKKPKLAIGAPGE